QPLVQRSGAGEAVVSPQFAASLQKSKGSRNPLPQQTRDFMESRFGTNFSGVRIHTGERAQKMNQQIGARAFTLGNEIYFNKGEFSPASDKGKHLLAHELTHVVQQGGDRSSIQRQEQPDTVPGNRARSP